MPSSQLLFDVVRKLFFEGAVVDMLSVYSWQQLICYNSGS